jgi:hypothetical protein
VTGEGLQQQLSSLQPVEGFDSCNENNCQEKIIFSIYTRESIDIKISKQERISFSLILPQTNCLISRKNHYSSISEKQIQQMVM